MVNLKEDWRVCRVVAIRTEISDACNEPFDFYQHPPLALPLENPLGRCGYHIPLRLITLDAMPYAVHRFVVGCAVERPEQHEEV